MFETKDFGAFGMVFLFTDVILHRCCIRVTSALNSFVFTMYSHIFFSAMQYSVLFEWTERRFSTFHNQFRSLKQSTVSILGPYRLSSLPTPKLHLRDYVIDDMRRFGRLHFKDIGIY